MRVNVPFRPPVTTAGGRLRPSRCLELPVSAPDCIQPLFAGDDVGALRRAVAAKVAFIRASGGLYVGIVHGGVFGRADALRRTTHLRFVRRRLAHPDVWHASLGAVADWWIAREGVTLTLAGDVVRVRNGGRGPVPPLRLVMQDGAVSWSRDVPALAPGETVVVPFARDVAREPERLRAVP